MPAPARKSTVAANVGGQAPHGHPDRCYFFNSYRSFPHAGYSLFSFKNPAQGRSLFGSTKFGSFGPTVPSRARSDCGWPLRIAA